MAPETLKTWSKKMKAGFYPGIVAFVFGMVVSALSVWLLVQGVAPGAFLPVAQMIVQLDSFLTAGGMIAFSFFWGNIVREYRGFRSLLSEFKEKLKDNLKALSELELLQEKAQLSGSFLLWGVSGVVGFAFSAFMALAAVATSATVLLIISLFSLVIGVSTMLQSWFDFHRSSEAVFDITANVRLIMARATKESAGAGSQV